jgi:predicted nucleotidyltransferase
MRILVFGNINAGKSRVVEYVRHLVPGLPILSIDGYRKKYGDGSFDGDQRAIQQFVSDVARTTRCVVECTGLGPLGTQLHDALSEKESVVLHVITAETTCLDRIAGKDFANTPYPPFDEQLPDTIRRCHAEFARGDLEAMWSDSALWTFPLSGESSAIERDVSSLPLSQLRALAEVVRVLKDAHDVDVLVWYGSGPRGELTPESDIDLFAVTTASVVELAARLHRAISDAVFHDTIGEKITLRFASGVLVEIGCGRQLSEIDPFYAESRIPEPSSSLLIGDQHSAIHLSEVAGRPIDRGPEIRYLVSECFYFILSLPPLARKNDRYKFYFHNNIIFHNIIRLKALESGDTVANYLPADALRCLSDSEIEILTFAFNQDMPEHYRNLVDYFGAFVATLRLPLVDYEQYVRYIEKICWPGSQGGAVSD